MHLKISREIEVTVQKLANRVMDLQSSRIALREFSAAVRRVCDQANRPELFRQVCSELGQRGAAKRKAMRVASVPGQQAFAFMGTAVPMKKGGK